jgi:heat shock protein HslJ
MAFAPPVTYTESVIGTTGERDLVRRALVGIALLVPLVAAVLVLAGHRSDPEVQPAAGTTTAAVQTVPLDDQVVGTWELEGIDTNAAIYRDRPVVRFDNDGTWAGSDGCNGLSGTWRVSNDGTFVADSGFQSLVGCHNVDYAALLNAAARVEIDGDRLTFHARSSGAASTLVRDPLALPDPPAAGWLPGYSFFQADRVVTDQRLIDQFAALPLAVNAPAAAGNRTAPPVAWYLGRTAGHDYFLIVYHSNPVCMVSFTVQNGRIAAVGCRARNAMQALQPLGDGSAFLVADTVQSVTADGLRAEFRIRDNVAIGGPSKGVTVTLADGSSQHLTSSGLEVVPSDP